MKYLYIHPENYKELGEMWEEVKAMFIYVANRPSEREKVTHLAPDEVLGSAFDFICELCIKTGISLENAKHPIEDAFFPKKSTRKGKNGVRGLICRHCHDCGF